MMKAILQKKTSWAGSESLWGDKRSLEGSGFIMLQFLILSSLNLTFGLNAARVECVLKLDGAWSGNLSFKS